tara:strand:+ start:1677 stop:2405 length:729 start_codon:yes stop_codon:yes gene_type:complete
MKKHTLIIILGFLPAFLSAEFNININGNNNSVSGNNVVIVNGKVAWAETTKGSGVEKKEVRDIGEFRGVDLGISADVAITYGENPSLNIVADDNILPIITTEVVDGELSISSNESYSTKTKIRVEIKIPVIDKLSISGSGNVSLDSVTKDKLNLLISGSGNIDATGSVANLTAKVSGSGDMRLKRLKTKNCKLTINGSGDAVVSVTEILDAKINGSGDISYYGKPQKVVSKVNGSGDIHPKG